VIEFISPNKLREGGAAIFDVHSINHTILITGIEVCSPFIIKRLRVFIRS
jgi:hypothetical protein